VDITTEWNEQPQVANDISEISTQVIEKLSNTQGIAQADGRDFKRATPKFKLKDGTMIRTYKNPAGVDHIFLADRSGRMLFGGYVGWMHSENLEATIAEIKETFVYTFPCCDFSASQFSINVSCLLGFQDTCAVVPHH
jgi:hypothetical protein